MTSWFKVLSSLNDWFRGTGRGFEKPPLRKHKRCAIEKYFNAEKQESLLFILVGFAALATSVYLLTKVKQPFYNGMAYTLIAVALIQLVVGTSVYMRSPKDIARVNAMLQSQPEKIASEEISRMEVVMRNFTIYRWSEIVLLIVGLIVFYYAQPTSLWKGVGLGLSIQTGFMLALDFFAETRGKTYLEFLRRLVA